MFGPVRDADPFHRGFIFQRCCRLSSNALLCKAMKTTDPAPQHEVRIQQQMNGAFGKDNHLEPVASKVFVESFVHSEAEL